MVSPEFPLSDDAYDPDNLTLEWNSRRSPALLAPFTLRRVQHRQQQVHRVSHVLTFALITGTIVTFTIGRLPCTLYGYANISRLGLLPLFTYYIVEKKEQQQLKSISATHAIVAMIDIAFTIYFIICDNYMDHVRPYYQRIVTQSVEPPSWMLDDFYRELTVPFWYRQFCLLLGLPTLIQGMLGLLLAYLIYALKSDTDSLLHAVAQEGGDPQLGSLLSAPNSLLGGPPHRRTPGVARAGRGLSGAGWPGEDSEQDSAKDRAYYAALMDDALARPFAGYNPFSRRSPFIRDRLLEQERTPLRPLERHPDALTPSTPLPHSRLMHRARQALSLLRRTDNDPTMRRPHRQHTQQQQHRTRHYVRERRGSSTFGRHYDVGGYSAEPITEMLGDMYVSDRDDDRRLDLSHSKLDVVVHKT